MRITTLSKGTTFNYGRLAAGIIVLGLGLLLAVLSFVLPEDRMMFMIGDDNLPIVPAIILVGLGIYLIVTSRISEEDKLAAEKKEVEDQILTEEDALNKRLEAIAWGLLLIMLGGTLFIPGEWMLRGLWSIGVGLIMLGLNAARYYNGIKMSGFTTLLGLVALLSGIGEALGLFSLDFPLVLIFLGAYLILKPWFDKRQLFG